MSTQEKKATPFGVTLTIVLFVAAFMATASMCSSSGAPTSRAAQTVAEPAPDPAQMAAFGCMRYVKNNVLKSPSTASYPNGHFGESKEVRPGVWDVRNVVDSQNSFGATLRGHYECEVHSSDGEHFVITKVTFNGQKVAM